MLFQQLHKKSDETLMLLVQQGNSKAMTELYRRYAPKLLRYFYRMLYRREAVAQDFLQDLFLRLIERGGQFRSNMKFATWLYSIAHNMCKNEYRKQSVRANQMGGFSEPIVDNLHDNFTQQEFREALDRVLDNMDEDDKNLFVLRHELEYSIEEIAVMVNCPEGTVKSRLFYLKKKLSQQLSLAEFRTSFDVKSST